MLNIGTAEETSVLDIARRVGGKIVHIRPNPRRHLEEYRKVADYTRAQAVLGWQPTVSFDEGMRRLL